MSQEMKEKRTCTVKLYSSLRCLLQVVQLNDKRDGVTLVCNFKIRATRGSKERPLRHTSRCWLFNILKSGMCVCMDTTCLTFLM